MYDKPQIIRHSRVLKKEEIDSIKFIEHLGEEPYNKIFFFNKKSIIVPYSLAYWHSFVGNDFERINKKYLVRKGLIEVVTKHSSMLSCGTELNITARQYKKYYKE